ncbi:MAG: HRDC domain-containing protein [Bacteroidetes bacterium]|nr:HRDC domain-containing protein [Bacteroidota bacterium]
MLHSPITSTSVKTDSRINNYSEEIRRNVPTEQELMEEKKNYQTQLMEDFFSMNSIQKSLQRLQHFLNGNHSTISVAPVDINLLIADFDQHVFSVAEKFVPTLRAYFDNITLPEDNHELQARWSKACVYMEDKLASILYAPLKEMVVDTDNKELEKLFKELHQKLAFEVFTKIVICRACLTRFTTTAYMQSKANAELDFEKEKAIKPTKKKMAMTYIASNADSSNVDDGLYTILREWRDEKAIEANLPHYMILSRIAITQLAEVKPQTQQQLLKVSGIGKTKVKQFGQELLELIAAYCRKNGIAQEESMPIEIEKIAQPKTINSSLQDTCNLFKEGRTLFDIAQTRGLAYSTIEKHIYDLVGRNELKLEEIINLEKINEIEEILANNTDLGLADFMNMHPGKYTYNELRMVKRAMLAKSALA